ncbi:BTB/POZ protein [Parachaetomium inaequale]|uniref:BTB/POZ protein n=1 Tax=Parachaetomium inaequale TaxID=2588326 RepID=A0AAN6SM70_9PEZI|nr:BTB/POZ protein [Parachaetomium inaequale]
MDDADSDDEEDSTAELRDAEPCATCEKAQNADRNPIDDLRTTSIFASLSALRLSEKFSDMTIRCGGRDFKAHRAIVCSQSSFFDGALSGGFSEAATGVVNLPEDRPEVVDKFLQFLYTGNYDDGNTPQATKPADASMMPADEITLELRLAPGVTVGEAIEERPWVGNSDYPPGFTEPNIDEPEEEYNPFDKGLSGEEWDAALHQRHDELAEQLGSLDAALKQVMRELRERENLFLPLRLYVMADKFDVPALKLLARDRFYRAAELVWRDAPCFPAVVDELYSNTAPTDVAMREIVCRLVGSGIRDPEQRERMGDVMMKHGDFAVGVMNYMLEMEKDNW